MATSSAKTVKIFAFLLLVLQLWTTTVSARSTNIRITVGKDEEAPFVTKSIMSSNSSDTSNSSSEDTRNNSESEEDSPSDGRNNNGGGESEKSKTSEEAYEEIVKTIETKHAHANEAVLMDSSSSDSGNGNENSTEDQASSEDDMKDTMDQASDAATAVGRNISNAIKSTLNKVGETLKNATDTVTEAVSTAIVKIKNRKGKRSLRYLQYGKLEPISFAEAEEVTETGDETTTERDSDDAEIISTATENITAEGGVIGHGKVDEESSSEKTTKESKSADKEESKQSKSSTTIGGQTSASTKQEPKGSATLDSAAAYPAFPIKRKPGICRPLTKGLACIALAPDASQCSTDNGCPGSKKCCFYGCPPYTNTGICEFPVLTGY